MVPSVTGIGNAHVRGTPVGWVSCLASCAAQQGLLNSLCCLAHGDSLHMLPHLPPRPVPDPGWRVHQGQQCHDRVMCTEQPAHHAQWQLGDVVGQVPAANKSDCVQGGNYELPTEAHIAAATQDGTHACTALPVAVNRLGACPAWLARVAAAQHT